MPIPYPATKPRAAIIQCGWKSGLCLLLGASAFSCVTLADGADPGLDEGSMLPPILPLDRALAGVGDAGGAGGVADMRVPSLLADRSVAPSDQAPDLEDFTPPVAIDQSLPPDALGPCGTVIGAGILEPSEAERQLAELINSYRVESGLEPIPVSPELGYVARRHSEDLVLNYPYADASCNLHSWSEDGDEWSPCCYTPDHAASACMWRKPEEMTRFRGKGYEISATGYGDIAAALRGWQSSEGHHNVILNRGIWANKRFEAMGVGICERVYNVWFGP